jgi:hypothetical protein
MRCALRHTCKILQRAMQFNIAIWSTVVKIRLVCATELSL